MILPASPSVLSRMSHAEIVDEYKKIGFDDKSAEAFATVFEKGGPDLIQKKVDPDVTD